MRTRNYMELTKLALIKTVMPCVKLEIAEQELKFLSLQTLGMLLLKCAEKAHSKMSLAKNGKIAKMLCKMSKTLLSHWHMKICSDLLKNCPKVPGFLRFQSRAMILSKRMRVSKTGFD